MPGAVVDAWVCVMPTSINSAAPIPTPKDRHRGLISIFIVLARCLFKRAKQDSCQLIVSLRDALSRESPNKVNEPLRLVAYLREPMCNLDIVSTERDKKITVYGQ